MNIKHYFLKIAIPLILLYWFIESGIHYFWYGELIFEIIPSDRNELWMRSTFVLLLTIFAIFADFISRKRNTEIKLKTKSEIITRAKRQWELAVDSLPQLVITMDHNARISRVNRTIESWGVGKVNKVDGLYVPDFLRCLNDDFSDDGWTSDWDFIWQQLNDRDTIQRIIENEHNGKIYQYSLRKITEYDASNDDCYAVLIVDDITARQTVENTLKNHAQDLEKKVNLRTIELQHANSQLEQELQSKKAAYIELKKSQDSRQALLREIFTTQEKERKRIACELHDSIGQSLGAAKFKIEELLIDKENFIKGSDFDQFNNLIGTIKNAVQEVRHIAMDLRPAMLDDLGVLATLKWFCREYENTYTQVKIDLSLNIDESVIPDENKVVIFRIVQEAMNNIAKHANATNIVLELTQSSAGIKVIISDNGCGFDTNLQQTCDADKPSCNFGLNSMSERAESTQGDFTIESTPGCGTSVFVSWKNRNILPIEQRISA
jgi:signal transduction histidine kinase